MADGALFETSEALSGGDTAIHGPSRQAVHQLGVQPWVASHVVARPVHNASTSSTVVRTSYDVGWSGALSQGVLAPLSSSVAASEAWLGTL